MRIALVEYLNTLPYLYALSGKNSWEILKAVPSRCLDFFTEGKVDLALVPVGGLADYKVPYKIITSFGIGSANKQVNSVFLFSDTPIKEISVLYLDSDSRTSNLLAQLLLKYYWKNSQVLIKSEEAPHILAEGEAVIRIGDKAMREMNRFQYAYDLATYWNKWKKLPFVFAVWIIRPELYSQNLENKLSFLFQEGINKFQNSLAGYQKEYGFSETEIRKYFQEHIRLFLTEKHKQALNIFVNLVSKEFSYVFTNI